MPRKSRYIIYDGIAKVQHRNSLAWFFNQWEYLLQLLGPRAPGSHNGDEALWNLINCEKNFEHRKVIYEHK
jgi:hypothetical protein